MQYPGEIKEAPPMAAGVGDPMERRLEAAVIETNEAVQAAARAVEQLAASVAAMYERSRDAGVRD